MEVRSSSFVDQRDSKSSYPVFSRYSFLAFWESFWKPICPQIHVSLYCYKVKCTSFVRRRFVLQSGSSQCCPFCLRYNVFSPSLTWTLNLFCLPSEHRLNEHGLTQCQGSFVPRILVDNELCGDSSKWCQFSQKKGVNDGGVWGESLSSLILHRKSKCSR